MTKIDYENKIGGKLLQILEKNKSVQKILNKAGELNMTNWYLGAGGVVQTVWNIKHGFEPEYGIKDYDLVYCDPEDISYESEDHFIQKAKEIFSDIPVPVEIKNEARVHVWYKKELGFDMDQEKYESVEDAIRAWSIIPTATGVRKNPDGSMQVYAPFGLDDLLNLVVRRADNPKISRATYEAKTDRWKKVWPKLKIIAWGQ